MQEDTFFNTENFFYMLGDLVSGGRMDYQGRILPVAYPTRDGQDGEVHIEFYAKDAGSPKVRLAWKIEGDPVEHEKVRDLPVVASAGHSRMVSAEVQAGKDGVESLTWRMPVDFAKDNYKDWIVLAEKSRVDRTIVSGEQADRAGAVAAEDACGAGFTWTHSTIRMWARWGSSSRCRCRWARPSMPRRRS